MRGAPWELLDVDPDAGMRSLELGNKRGDDLAFATHSPEADHGLIWTRAAAGGDEDGADRDQACERTLEQVPHEPRFWRDSARAAGRITAPRSANRRRNRPAPGHASGADSFS